MVRKKKADTATTLEALRSRFAAQGYDLTDEQLAQLPVANAMLRQAAPFYEGFWDGAGEPHREFLESTHRRRLFLGGNRSGKTATGCWEGARFVRGLHPHWRWDEPLKLLVVTSTLDILGAMLWKEYYSRFIPEAEVKEIIKHDHAPCYCPSSVELHNGNTITLAAYTQGREALQGKAFHAIHMDEECKREIFEELDKRLLDRGGPWWMTATAVEGSAYLLDLEELAEAPVNDVGVWHVSVWDNVHNLARGAVEEMERSLSEEQKAIRMYGQLGNRVGLVYARWPVSELAEPTGRDEIPRGLPVVRGVDIGWTNNTAAVWVAVGPGGDCYVVDEYAGSRRSIGEHAAAMLEIDQRHHMVDGVMDRNGWALTAGVTAPVALQYSNAGIKCRPAGNVAHSLLPMIEVVWEYMGWLPERPKLYIGQWCRQTLSEMRKYRWPSADGEKNMPDKPVDAWNHLLDALRYVVAERPNYASLKRRMDPARGRGWARPGRLRAPAGQVWLDIPERDQDEVQRYG